MDDLRFFKANCFKSLDKIDSNDYGNLNNKDPLLDLKQDELDEAKKKAAQDASSNIP